MDREMNNLLDTQIHNATQLNKVLVNIRKLSQEKRTERALEKELDRGRGIWVTFRDTHQKLLKYKDRWKETNYVGKTEQVRQDFVDLREFVRAIAPALILEEDEKDALTTDPVDPNNADETADEEEPARGLADAYEGEFDLKAILKMITESNHLIAQSMIAENESTKRIPTTMQMPELVLQPFSGVMKEYRRFKATFIATVDRYELSIWDKFSLLSSKLIGEAKEEIAGLEIREENYEKAWNLLDQRFEHRRNQIFDLLMELDSFPPMKIASYESIKKYARVAKGIANNVESMNLTRDDILMFYLLKPVPPIIRGKFFEQIKCGAKMPTVCEFIDFLTSEEEILRQYEEYEVDDRNKK